MKNKKNNKMKITKEQILVMERAVRRTIDIENGFKGCQHKVHKMATDYNRKQAKRVIFDD
jgi:hypothetical protein